MTRILLRRDGVLRKLASIHVTHDGSLRLSLVRNGTTAAGWTFHSIDPAPQQVVRTAQKTKDISIHTSGRINYHFDNASPRFIPPLMDLEEPVVVLGYRVPGFDLLDVTTTIKPDDSLVELASDCCGVIQFHFLMVAAATPFLDGELTRFGVEGLFALVCVNTTGATQTLPPEIPNKAFTTLRPSDSLPRQAITEQAAYLRFRRAMFVNDIRAAAETSEAPISEALIEASIASGPGLYAPNGEGVWTLVTAVEMRDAPKLEVQFETDELYAEIVELRPGDTRLATVRVRFRVRDGRGNYVKGLVPIRRVELDTEL